MLLMKIVGGDISMTSFDKSKPTPATLITLLWVY